MATASSEEKLEDAEYTRTVVLTGGTGIIGAAIAQGLAIQKRLKLILVCRNEAKGKKLAKSLKYGTGSTAELVLADFTSIESTLAAVDKIKSENASIDALINDAVIAPTEFQRTADGFEQQFQVNVLTYFLISNGLLDCIKKSPGFHGLSRIVHVGSYYASVPLPKSLEDFAKWTTRPTSRYDNDAVYQQTKRADRMLATHLASLLKTEGLKDVGAYSCHPGDTQSAISMAMGFYYSADTPQQSAASALHLALSDKVTVEQSGRYFKRSGRSVHGEIDPFTTDATANKALWDYCRSAFEDYVEAKSS